MRWLLGKILCLAGRHYWLKPGNPRDFMRRCLHCGKFCTDDLFEPYSYPPPLPEDERGGGDNPMLEFFHGTGNREAP